MRGVVSGVGDQATGMGRVAIARHDGEAVLGAELLQGRVALGPRAGELVRRLRSAAAATPTGRRSARLAGFSLHADVAVPARQRDQLERVCRYLLRPPLAVERLTESTGGQLLYQFKRPWRDGSETRKRG